jgi:hypothetical protein
MTAGSVDERADFGVSALKEMGGRTRSSREPSWRFRCASRSTCDRRRLEQILRWCDGLAASPDETLKNDN